MLTQDHKATEALQKRLRQRITAKADLLQEITRNLVRIDSQTPPSATGPIAAEVARILGTAPGIETRILESEPPVVNLVATLSGGQPGPRLVLNGHLDTYPVGDPSAWSVDPLGGRVADGKLYGRGSADMKGGLAAQILVALALAEESEPWPGELVLAFAGDEESMGVLGSQWLIENEPVVHGDGVLIADVGSPEIVRCGEKGMIWLTLQAEGRAAHGAHVHRGVNAVDRLLVAIHALSAIADEPVETPPAVARTIAAAKIISEPLGGIGEADVMQKITVNVGRISGGISANLVPDAACAEADIRLPLGTTVAEVEARIEQILSGVAGVSYRITRRYEPTWTNPEERIVTATVSASGQILGRPALANMRVGASDARLFRAAGLPTAVCGLTPFNLGAADEYLLLEELQQLSQILAHSTTSFLTS